LRFAAPAPTSELSYQGLPNNQIKFESARGAGSGFPLNRRRSPLIVSGTAAGGSAVSNTTATVMANGFQAFVSNRHGKFYASFALMGDDAPQVAIMGPYKTEREAKKMVDKWGRLNQRLMDAEQPLQFVDMKTVPADVPRLHH
jgi:hypothetical protein